MGINIYSEKANSTLLEKLDDEEEVKVIEKIEEIKINETETKEENQ